MDETLFTGVEVTEIEISGVHIHFPVRYYDEMAMGASFPASIDQVQKMLPSTRLKPIQPTPSTAMISLGAIEYRRIEGMAPCAPGERLAL